MENDNRFAGVIVETAQRFGTTVERMLGFGPGHKVSLARWAAAWVARTALRLDYEQIANQMKIPEGAIGAHKFCLRGADERRDSIFFRNATDSIAAEWTPQTEKPSRTIIVQTGEEDQIEMRF